MQQLNYEEIIKIQAKGLMTIPKSFRDDLDINESDFVRLKKDKGRIILEPIRILPYLVRTYSDKEVDDFFEFDKLETRQLKKKGLL